MLLMAVGLLMAKAPRNRYPFPLYNEGLVTDTPKTPETRPQPPKLLPLIVGIGLLAFFAGVFQMARNPSQDLPDSALVGKPAPAFTLERLEPELAGQVLDYNTVLAEGRPMVINMWASWCVGCKQEAADLERFWHAYQGRVSMLGLALQDKVEAAREFAEDYDQNYPLAMDEKGRVGIDYGILGLPETFVIDAEGIVRHRFTGPVTVRELEAAVLPLLKKRGDGA